MLASCPVYGKDLDSSVSIVTANELSNHNSMHDRCTDLSFNTYPRPEKHESDHSHTSKIKLRMHSIIHLHGADLPEAITWYVSKLSVLIFLCTNW